MSERLPAGWVWVSVGDLVATRNELTDGPFGSNLKTEHYQDSGPRVIRLQNIGDGEFFDDEAHVSAAHFARLRKHEAVAGDIVVAMLGSDLPRACLVPRSIGPAIVKADCVRLRPDSRLVDARYAVAGFNSPVVRRQAKALVHGVGRPRLGLKWFRTLRLSLAPVAEQARIVDAVDSYVTRLDAAVRSLEHAQTKLKVYRASVLKAAVEGRLVPTEAKLAPTERRSYESADVLLERILKERRRRWEQAELEKMKVAGKAPKDDRWKAKYETPAPSDANALPDLPKGWCWVRLSALLSEPLRNGHSARATKGSGGVRTLTLSAVTEADFGLHNTKLTSAAPEKVSDLWLRSGDIFVERSNTPELVGLAALYRGPDDLAIFPDLLIRVRCHPEVVPEFLEAVLLSSRVRRCFRGAAKGIAGTMPKIGQSTIENVVVPLPPTDEQQSIVNELQRLHSCVDAIERGVRADLARCRRLRQGVLTWAFEGKLVDQDAADEPADVLLARIRAERAAATLVKPKQRRARKLKAAS